MVTKLKTGTKVGQLGIWDGTQWVAGDPDCNIVKWGSTTLSGRDITTLLDHLNVNLDTRARLQPWYQPNFTVVAKSYNGQGIAPHAWTNRWSYTVPANRLAILSGGQVSLYRATAAGTAALTQAEIWDDTAKKEIYIATIRTNTVGDHRDLPITGEAVFLAGEAFISDTTDASTTGTIDYIIATTILVFDT